MRNKTIWFRGKSTDDGEWIAGSYLHRTTPVIEDYKVNKNDKHPIFPTSIIVSLHEIDRDTVGQYTGLDDKNGKMIYEGDIVRYNGTDHEVVFETRNGSAFFGIVMDENETWPFGRFVPANQMEVVGNVHDKGAKEDEKTYSEED